MKNVPDHGTRWNRKWKYGVPLSRLDFEILIAIAMECNTNKQLHEKLRKRRGKNVPKSTISRHTTKLVNLGLITRKKIYNLRPFELTEKAKVAISIFLTRGEEVEWNLVRGHAFGFVCKILRKPRDLEERLKKKGWAEFHPRNWNGYTKPLWGCTVVFSPSSVQFVPQEVYAASGEAAFDEVFRLVQEVQTYLMEEYPGLVLSPLTFVYNQSYARVFDPLALEFMRTSAKEGVNVTYRSDRVAIDASKGLPELETVHKVFSKDDLRLIAEFYEGLVRHSFRIEDFHSLQVAITEFAENLKLHYGVLNGIQGVLGDVKSAVQQLSEIEQNRALPLPNSPNTQPVSMSDLAVVLGARKAEIHKP